MVVVGCYALPPAAPAGGSTGSDEPAVDMGGSDDDGEPGEVSGDRLCEPCSGQGQCGEATNLCIRNREGEQFCARMCDRGRCPAGFECTDVGADHPLQCIPEGESCRGARPDDGDPEPEPDDEVPDDAEDDEPEPEPEPDPDDEEDDLGECTGTEAECEAWRVINEYRTAHQQQGECTNALEWNAEMGRLAHEHQSGPFVGHSSNGYVENVGQAYGVRETAEYIIQWEGGFEDHCAADGSYVMSHHCAAMFCNNFTAGVGVYQDGETTYMTMMFGGRDGQPNW
ncbi:MAG: hypothetical protein HYY06_03155 [Deltaproteobacteria bacterium]|nr:hypothetical protein [Deltaproteobacteria bacterium]